MSLRSPLGRVLGLGSAKGGATHWYMQRVTAVALVLLGTWFLGSLAMLDGAGLDAVRAWLHSPVSSVLAVLFVAVAAYHASLGLQVVVEDYVADRGARFAALLAVKFALAVAALVGIFGVMRIAFGVGA